MSTQKMAKLIRRLATSTEEGKLRWEETASQDVFQASFPGYSVQLSFEKIYNDTDYYLMIFNEGGEIVESVNDTDMKNLMDDAYSAMRELYEAARRSAMGVDKAIDSILGALDGEDDIPF